MRLNQSRGKGSRPVAAALVLVIAGAAVLWLVASRATGKERPMTSPGSVVARISTDDLARVSRAKVFFGHQSVGMNILSGVGGVYAAHDKTPPVAGENVAGPGRRGGFIDHAFIGENGKPAVKIEDFAARLRSGLGQRVDVAMMKFCYADITSGTDVSALFATYRTTMAALAQEFPKVTFIYATVPLTTEPGLLSRLKSKLTGSGGPPADNAARERFNALIRQEYAAGGHLFDLAAAESTAPDGSRTAGTYDGQRYYALNDGYAADSGHLNAEGSRVVATAWLLAVARAPGT